MPVIDSIRIESRWTGYGEPHIATYTIMRRGDHYERLSSSVPEEKVNRFLAAITAAPVQRKTAVSGLVTPEWLLARSSEPHDNVSAPVCSVEAKQRLRQHLADPAEAVKALDEYLSASWTDDYPLMSVDVTFQDREAIHLESHQQPALMLPWTVGKSESWNPDISRAIVDLLPSGSEPRLTDRVLATAYVTEVLQGSRHEIDDLEERCVHRDFLEAVEKKFEVVRIYRGSPGWFSAYVRRADFPSNLVLTLVIRDVDKPGARAKLDRTVLRTYAYVDRARSYVGKHPEKTFAIWCADGISVAGNKGAISISDYDVRSGIVSDPHIILPDGRVTQDR